MANGIGIINGFDVNSSSPIDKRYGVYTGTTIGQCISNSLATIQPIFRYEGLTIGLKPYGSNLVEYWFIGGTEDIDLKIKSTVSNVILVTYDEIISLISSNGLEPLQQYQITDHITTYTQPITLTPMSGTSEPLIVESITSNKIRTICKSTIYPQDIVYYSIDDNTSGFTKGKIYRRIDTLLNNDIGTDWRNIKYRRWSINVTNTWVSGDSYALYSVVSTNNDIYICTSTNNGWENINDNFTSTGLVNNTYVSNNGTGIQFIINGNGIIIPSTTFFKDVTMFNEI